MCSILIFDPSSVLEDMMRADPSQEQGRIPAEWVMLTPCGFVFITGRVPLPADIGI
ncbi:hypothetical protein KP509_16G073600 [Ceratopteris richardii]|uniref:Uncharacterized protein n=1 Tax=Ceratopteris richardii TaxID=49495 RepID=A0A8T2T5M0_CERRI|nr:hypothetical protein KP509_16G073600 [Ceratopteris richardii]